MFTEWFISIISPQYNRMGITGWRGICCVFLCVCLLVLAAPGVATTQTVAAEPWIAIEDEDGEVEADFLRMEIELAESGDADWQVVFQQTLEDDDETDAFESIEEEIDENPEAYLDPFETRMTAMVIESGETTDREMKLENLTATTEREPRPQDTLGNIIFTFEWRGFATSDDDSLRAGDAIAGLPLDENEVLEMSWPEQYELESDVVQPTASEDDKIVWHGPLTFARDEPDILLTETPTEPESPEQDADETDESDEPDESGLGATTLLGAGGVLLVAVGLAGAALLLRRQGTETQDSDDSKAETDREELLSPEERVLRLLEENDGRIKQKRIGEQTGWSDARTSQVVGDLREQGAVESFRIGRENVLTLPEVNIDSSDESVR